jgi:hypothetical protein
MSHNELKPARRGGRGLIEARQRRRFLPSLLGLEDRKLLATFTVTNTLDNGSTGSLGWAVGQANTTSGNNTINFDPTAFATPKTITLTSVLDLTSTSGTETIVGPAAGVTVSGGGSTQVLNLASNTSASITGLTISDGNVSGNGGGINNSGTLDLIDSTIAGSTASGVGGGMFNNGSGNATLINCSISGNTNNSNYGGGGIYNDGTIALTASTITGNYSVANGGGIYINYGPATLTNCTISGNSAAGSGGGLQFYSGMVTINSCTVTGNSSGSYGGGFYAETNSTATLTNTIVAGNSATDGDDDIHGNASGTYNLIGTGGSGGLSNGVDGNLVGVSNPDLGPLDDYGGPTETIPLLPGSPAINAGTSSGAPVEDQRGLGRYGSVDIGSFESQGFTFSVVPGGTPQSSPIGTEFANPLAVTLTANNPVEPVDGTIINFVSIPSDGGASAYLSSSSVVVTGGVASVYATPNDVDGSYVIDASSTGFATTFALTNTGTTLVVNTTSDSLDPGAGLLSLREAIADDNSAAFPNPVVSITFDPTVFATPQTISLTNGVLELSGTASPITIIGPAVGVTVSGGGSSEVFAIETNVSASITGLTISDGNATGNGGGLYNAGTLDLIDCTISGNIASGTGGGMFDSGSGNATLTDSTIDGNTSQGSYGGGGIYSNGTISLTGCTISGNDSSDRGGGIYLNYGTTTLTNCTISGNTAAVFGGGVQVYAATVTLNDCTVTDNSAEYGGGIFDFDDLTLTGCMVSGNTALMAGGGLFTSSSGTATLNGSLFSDNTAYYSYAGNLYGNGGGLYLAGNTTLTECIITGNTAGNAGGGFLNTGTLTLNDCTIDDNTSSSIAGGFLTVYNPVTLTGCTISGNTAGTDAGGIYNGVNGTLTLTDCTISGNSATGKAGGLYNAYYGTTNLIDSTVSGNTAGTVGGGVVGGGDGTLNLTGTTVNGNIAYGNGGGIYVQDGTANLTNSTISGNTANNGGGIDFYYSTSSTLTNCTISGNTATGSSGGGINNDYSTISLANSIVAANYGEYGAGDINISTGSGTLPAGTISGNNDLIGIGGSGGLVDGVDGNLVGVADPLLSPLGNYGGPTQTIGLLPGSPALDAGIATYGITTDQRGITISGTADIGAFYSEGFTDSVVPGSTPQLAGSDQAFGEPLAVTVTPVNPLDPVAGGVVNFTVGQATSGASATLSSSTATIDSDGVAGVTATANGFYGSYTVSASIPGSTEDSATFTLTNVVPLQYTGISSQTVTQGTSVIFSGALSNGVASPVGQTVTITLDGVTQDAVISPTGTFTTTFSTTDVPASATPYTVSYLYSSDGVSFGSASTTSQLTVTPVITFGPIPNQVYGVAPLTLSGTASSGLSVTYVVVSGPATLRGNILTITGAGVVEIEAEAGNSTVGNAPPVDESFTVSTATLTVTPKAGQSKVYGAAVPTLSGVVTGFVDGDTSFLLTGSIGTTATASSSVGTYAFTIGTLSAGPNYTIIVAASPLFSVTPASLTVTPTAGQSKIYGASVPLLTGTVTGFVNGDTSLLVTGAPGTVATSSSNVGTYAFSVGTLSAGANYTLVVAASPLFSVTPASLTLTPTAGQSKVYGAAVPVLTGTVSGFVNGDTSTLLSGAPGTVATVNSDAGTYAFTSGTLIAGSNYIISVAPSPTFAVTPASLTVTPTAGQSKVYGAALPDLTGTVTGFVNGDTSSLLSGSLGTTATVSSGVGTYGFTVGAFSAGPNYTVSLAASPLPIFAVTPATLVIDPTAGQSKLYGSPIPTLTYTAIGLVNGDTSTVLTGSLSTSATTASPIPNYYSYTLGTLYAGPNYTLSLPSNAPSFVVNRAPLVVDPASGQSKVYGATVPILSYTVSGFVDGDNASIVTGILVTTATHSSPVGDYPITLGTLFAGADYYLTLSSSAPTFGVTPATLTVDPTADQSKAFGAAVPVLTYTVTGLVNGDTSSVLSGSLTTTATATSDVGTYPFTIGSLTAGPNYSLTLDPSSPSFTVATNAVDLPPVAANQNYSTLQGTLLSTTTSDGVLAGNTDPNGLPLTALLVSSPSHGSLTLSANGSFNYTPVLGFYGTDSFEYQVNDGNSISDIATVSLDVKAPVEGDYFGTGLADAAIYLANVGDFAILNPQTGTDLIIPFGVPGAGQTIPAPGDYFGNGVTDIAAYIPSQGVYVIRNPDGGPDVSVPFGIVGAGQTIPAPGDYFGTGVDDLAVYLPSIGAFAIRNPAGGPDEIIPFGMPGLGNSIPVPGDYDGSGKTELAVYMPSLGEFAYRPANGGPDVVVSFGIPGTGNSIPMPGDYDGSGKTEFAVYLPSLGEFAYRPANGGADVLEQFGIAGAGQTLPAPGDYTGVGYDELAVFIPSTATFAIRPGGGQPDVSGSFGAAGLGSTFPVTVVDQALAEMTDSTVSAGTTDSSTNTEAVIFPTTTTTTTKKKKKHTS